MHLKKKPIVFAVVLICHHVYYNYIHLLLIRRVYAICSPLLQPNKLTNDLKIMREMPYCSK